MEKGDRQQSGKSDSRAVEGGAPGASIRAARPSEAAALTELALRSKAHWGYDADFIRDCRAELTLTPDYVGSHPVFVAEEGGRVVGFYSLKELQHGVELEHLFVEPAFIGAGCGTRLWRHAVERARDAGFSRMVIQSDPFAERFYLAMGARRVGEIPSSVRPGRVLPLLEYTLA